MEFGLRASDRHSILHRERAEVVNNETHLKRQLHGRVLVVSD